MNTQRYGLLAMTITFFTVSLGTPLPTDKMTMSKSIQLT